MEQRITVGIDLAKEIFAVCVLNTGEIVERQRLRRAVFERIESQPFRASRFAACLRTECAPGKARWWARCDRRCPAG